MALSVSVVASPPPHALIYTVNLCREELFARKISFDYILKVNKIWEL